MFGDEYRVRGLALSGIAAENLEQGSGIESRTIASLEHSLAQGRDVLTSQDILVIDEAGMVGIRQMERLLSQAAEVQAKIVLVGDPKQLQAIEAGAAFRAIAEGQIFGWPNQLLGLSTAAGYLILVVSSMLMRWRRRPEGALGAPAEVLPRRRISWALIGLIATLGFLLPVLGLSRLVTLAGEAVIRRHYPAASRWLGLNPVKTM